MLLSILRDIMKFLLSFLTFSLASASQQMVQKLDSLSVESPLGAKLMSKARRLENDDEIDFSWVKDFSIKFQGCHHVSQWNEDGDDEYDVKIQTKRLIRFRLCPTDSCSTSNGGGCTSGYGDYIIDMNTFLESYYDAAEEYNQWKCEWTLANKCSCDDDDGQGDDFDEEKCEYDCYAEYSMTEICSENDYYNDDDGDQGEKFDLADYVECSQAEFNNDRRLEEEEVAYYLGPYCSEQGGAIYMGMFTDESCTAFADGNGGANTYASIAGTSLPYSQKSVITMDCFSCKEPEDADNNNDGNDNEDEDEVIEMCEQIYSAAGKCETGLQATGYITEANENACNYISGIKVIRQNGIITQVGSKANKTASIFIGIFVVAFVLLAAYVYYLKTKLDRASINLSE
jgi:hypothetical protein